MINHKGHKGHKGHEGHEERVWRGKSRGLDPRLLGEVGDLGPSKGLQPIKTYDIDY
jgi:hypothetical protein